MTQPITFTINNEEIKLIFNVASLNAMSKVLFGNQSKAFEISELLSEINKLNEENFWSAAKVIIYSGVVGFYLESEEIRPKYSFKQVGELVGKMTEPELVDYTLKVWEAFLDDLGVNLEKLVELDSEEDSTAVKKK